MSKGKICIVDYGLGNLFNVQRAFHYIGAETVISDSPETIFKSDKIVLPGVGAFGEGIKNLNKKGLAEALEKSKVKGKPILGICLGMQLLLSRSEENGNHAGLNFITGKVVRFPTPTLSEKKYKIPQISWNRIMYSESQNENRWKKTILNNIPNRVYMYFVHSYYAQIQDPQCSIAVTTYGNTEYSSVIRFENVMGCQFHPERSGKLGLEILENFLLDSN